MSIHQLYKSIGNTYMADLNIKKPSQLFTNLNTRIYYRTQINNTFTGLIIVALLLEQDDSQICRYFSLHFQTDTDVRVGSNGNSTKLILIKIYCSIVKNVHVYQHNTVSGRCQCSECANTNTSEAYVWSKDYTSIIINNLDVH